MAIEVQIETGGSFQNLQEIVDKIKELKAAARAAKTEEEFQKITQELGRARKAFKDFNDDVKTQAAGSAFEKLNRQTAELGDNLRNLNFEDAGGDLTNLATTIKGIDTKSLNKGLGELKTGFLALGRAILTNPLTWYAAGIAAISAALLVFLNKLGVVTKAAKFFGDIIDDLVQGFKNLTDAMGLTSFAADELAQSQSIRSKIIVSSLEQELGLLKLSEKTALDKAKQDLELAKIQKKSLSEIRDLEKDLFIKQAAYNTAALAAIDKKIAANNDLKNSNKSLLASDAQAALNILMYERKLKDVNEQLTQMNKELNPGTSGLQIPFSETLTQIGLATTIPFDEKSAQKLAKYNTLIAERDRLEKKIEETQDSQLVTLETLFKLDEASLNLKLDKMRIGKDEKELTEVQKNTIRDLYKAEKELGALKISYEQEATRIANERTLAEARYTQAVKEETEKQKEERIKKEQEFLTQALEIRKELSEKTLQIQQEEGRRRLKAGGREGTRAELNMELDFIRENYETRLQENFDFIKDLQAQEAALVEKNNPADLKQIEYIRAQIKLRKDLENALLNEIGLAQDEYYQKWLDSRKEEQAEWQKTLDQTLLTESQRILKKKDKDIKDAQDYVDLRTKQIDEDLKLYDKDSDNYKKLMSEKSTLLANFELYKLGLAKTTEKELAALAQKSDFDFKTQLEFRTQKLVVFSKNRLQVAKDEALKRLEAERNAEKSEFAKKLAAIQGDGQAEIELRKSINDQLLALEKDYQTAKTKIEAANPSEFARENQGVITQEFAAEFGKRLQVAQEFNDALSQFSQARLNRDLAAAGDNEQAQEDAREKEFKRNQNFAAVNAIVSGAQAVTQALAVQPPGVGIALAAVTALKVAGQVAAIKSAKYQRGGGGSTPTSPNPGSVNSGQPSFSFFGQANTGNNQGATGSGNRQGAPGANLTIDVNISESEITSTQKRVVRMANAAQL
jgi:hypothetical protein